MKRKLLSFLTAALLLLPALTTAASPGFVCDNCDYEASSYAQRDITVQKDGGTVKVREYYCPGCNTVFSSVEVPDSYRNSPNEDEEEKPAPSSNESKETDPPKAGEEATVDTNTNTNTTTDTNTNTNTNTNNNTNTNPEPDPAIQIVQQTPEQPQAGKNETTTVTTVAATDVRPEEPVKEEEAAIVYVQPEQPVSNTKATENAEPEKPVTGTSSDPEPAQIAPEQPVQQSGSDEVLSLVPEKPAEEENTQAVTYVEPPAPAADSESPVTPPEEPVPKIRNHPESAGAELTTEAPIVLVTEKPAEPAEAPPVPQPQAELTAPPAPEVTLPPVIAEQPTETPPPTEPPKVTPTPKPRTSSNTTTEKYPSFSRFFPARRLHLKGDPEARAQRAGILIWPEEPGMSLLERMLNADP